MFRLDRRFSSVRLRRAIRFDGMKRRSAGAGRNRAVESELAGMAVGEDSPTWEGVSRARWEQLECEVPADGNDTGFGVPRPGAWPAQQ